MEEGPRIAFIDDHTEELDALSDLVQRSGASISEVRSPAQVDEELLKLTDLIVVDYTLDDWIDNEPVEQLSLRPVNGVALAAVLRQHSAKLRDFPPTGFALITGQGNALGPLPAERRPHVISRLNNVEWFFEKAVDAGGAQDNATMAVSLAKAIAELPKSVGTRLGNMDALMTFLGAVDHDVQDRLRDAVHRCRPPIHHLAERSHGLMILRWILHRILPHTTFLLDRLHLAARLHVTPTWLYTQLHEGSALEALLAGQRYHGPLSDFDGPRWWRDGVEQLLWDATDGNSSKPKEIHKAMMAAGIEEPDDVGISRPVVTLDHNLNVNSEFSPAESTVPLHLDDWPSYAEPAFIRKEELAEHEQLKMYVAEDE